MNITLNPQIVLLLSLALSLAFLGACSKSSEPAGHEAHDDHGHAEAKTESGQPPAVKMCKEHNVPLDQCGICKPELLQKLGPGQGMKVRLASPESAGMVQIQTAPAQTGTIAESVECYAEIAFNQNKFAQVVAPVSGIIQEVEADLGCKVEEKQRITRIWSASIAEAVAKAVLTHQTLDRERRLRADHVTSEKELQEAEATHRAACQPLRLLGFTEEQVDAMAGKPQESVLLDVRAPFAGEIVERMAVRGAMVEVGKPLVTVADRSTMWAMLNVPESALARVHPGQTVELRLESIPDRVFTGKLTWIGAEIDERTRMGRARAEVANPDGLLKARMFAQARILINAKSGALLLPASAIQTVEGKPMIFVKLEEDLFDARFVSVGCRENGRLEILAGLKPQESVVVNHGFVMKTQLLISRLGAGCADD